MFPLDPSTVSVRVMEVGPMARSEATVRSPEMDVSPVVPVTVNLSEPMASEPSPAVTTNF